MRKDEPAERIKAGQAVARGRYVLLEVLGRGGLATVFRARDTHEGSEVALKVLRDRYVGRPEREERLRREFEYAARVDHPDVIDVGELGTLEDGRPFFSMELVEGRPLSGVLSGSGGLSFERMRRLTRALAVALDAVHRAGIVHRDVKPANVLVLDGDRIKLIDFGMAGDDDAPAVPAGHTSRLTRANDLLGTHEYMAPEQVLKRSPRRSMDVFALGVVMYELLSSNTPYSGMGVREYVELQIAGDPLLRSAERWGRIREAPAELAVLIDDCRRRDPRQRPVDMQEVIRRLDALEVPTEERAMAPAIGESAVMPGVMVGESVIVPEVAAVESAVMPGAAMGVPHEPAETRMVAASSPALALMIGTSINEGAASARAPAVGRSHAWWRPTAWVVVPAAATVVLWLGLAGRGTPKSGAPTALHPLTAESAEPAGLTEASVLVGTPDRVSSRTAGSWTADGEPMPSTGGSAEEDDARPESTADTDGAIAERIGGASPEAGATEIRGGNSPSAAHAPMRRPERRSAPSAPRRSSAEGECARHVTDARAAFTSYRWPAVLAHTRDASCWSAHRVEHLRMRTEALMEEERWTECVRTGRRSSDPEVQRFAERCHRRLARIAEAP